MTIERNGMPSTEAVTIEEGGPWYRWSDRGELPKIRTVHSVRFSDGSIWDAVNGWRPVEGGSNARSL